MSGGLYEVTPAVFERLEWLAMGFNKTGFMEGKRWLRSEPTEVHIDFSSLQERKPIPNSRYQIPSAQTLWQIYAYAAI